MSLMVPFHSIAPHTDNVYHNNNQCPNGSRIPGSYRSVGTDGRPLCEHCRRLNERGK